MYTAIEHGSLLSLSLISPSHSLCFSLRPKVLFEAPRPPWPNLLLKAVRRPLPKLSCSRQADLHGLIFHLLCAVRPTTGYVARIPRMAKQITLSAIRVVTHVPLRPDPFYYSLFGNIKLNYNIGILCYTLANINKYVAHHHVFSYIV